MNYEEAKLLKAELTLESIAASKALNSIDGIGSGAMGLTPDSVKATIEYKIAKNRYAAAHNRIRKFNRLFMKCFKQEYKAERLK